MLSFKVRRIEFKDEVRRITVVLFIFTGIVLLGMQLFLRTKSENNMESEWDKYVWTLVDNVEYAQAQNMTTREKALILSGASIINNQHIELVRKTLDKVLNSEFLEEEKLLINEWYFNHKCCPVTSDFWVDGPWIKWSEGQIEYINSSKKSEEFELVLNGISDRSEILGSGVGRMLDLSREEFINFWDELIDFPLFSGSEDYYFKLMFKLSCTGKYKIFFSSESKGNLFYSYMDLDPGLVSKRIYEVDIYE